MTTVETPRLGTLTYDLLQTALDRFDLGRLIAAQATTTGNFGQNVFLSTTKGRFVFRGNPLIARQFEREAWAAQAIHDRTNVRAPWPYYVADSNDPFDWDWAIMTELEGTQFVDRSVYDALPFEQRLEVARSMGETAAAIHASAWSAPGHWSADVGSVTSFEPDYATWILDTIRELIGKSIDVTDEDRTWLLDLIARFRPVMERSFAPVLLHGDFSINNVVANRNDGVWKVSGVYDLMSSHVGHSDTDLTRQFAMYVEEDPLLATTFLHTYDAATSDRSRNREQFLIFLIHERLKIWEWAKRTGVVWWSDEGGLRDWLETYFNHVP